MVNLSSFESLSLVNEDGEFTYGSFEDEGQTIQLATYGKLFSISRQSIINDDLNAFTRIPAGMGRAASRTVGDVAYGVLTANGLLSDGIALFAGTAIGTTHGNLDIGGGAAIAVASVDAARVGMARQSDVSGEATALGIRPAWFVVPVALEGTAKVLMASEFDPADGTNNNRAPNSVRGIMKVVSEVRLDIADPAAWYLAANGDTIQVAFLDGQQAPVLEQQMGWSIDGSEYKVRIDVAAAAEDFRGLQTNDGP
jgi:phage major head subunit gpT-like protein